MYNDIVIILLAFVVPAHAHNTTSTQDSRDNFVDKLVSRGLLAQPIHHTNLENTMLEKGSGPALSSILPAAPPQHVLVSLRRAPLSTKRTSMLSRKVPRISIGNTRAGSSILMFAAPQQANAEQAPVSQQGSEWDSILSLSPEQIVDYSMRNALIEAFGEEVGSKADPRVSLNKPDMGDYRSNAVMPLGKQLKQKTEDLAATVIDKLLHLKVAEGKSIGSADISRGGIINIKLSDDYVKHKLVKILEDKAGRLGIDKAVKKQRIVVDFSSPNIAKEMHVGHLRSTIIGDSLSNLLSFIGHDVKRLNHVGDWGTQFGMLIKYMQEQSASESSISDLVTFYKAAKKRFDEDDEFKNQAREEVVKLQAGDESSLMNWKRICQLSRDEFQVIYDRLNITGLEERGESFYNPMLKGVVDDLKEKKITNSSEGAECVYVDGYKNQDDTPFGLIVQKSDGGFLYATTDLAAVKHRVFEEKADRALYVTDVGQKDHFDMVFKTATKAGWAQDTELVHVPFGLVLGEDGKKFKTRSGDTVKLKDLLDEAVDNSIAEMESRNDGQPLTEEQRRTAKVLGLGAVKYADLSMNRESNYRFSFKKMLQLQGNTAPYMLYAYVRINGIRRKAKAFMEEGGLIQGDVHLTADEFILDAPEEMALAKTLLRLQDVLLLVEKELYPNKICDYLFELAGKFNQFYDRCPVIKAETPALVKSRTALCTITSETLGLMLNLLGIETLDRI